MVVQAEFIEKLKERFDELEKLHPGLLEDEIEDASSLDRLVDELTGPFLRRVLQVEMTDDLGPYYDTASLMRRWKVSRQAVSKRRAHGSLLALTTDDGRLLFPLWQFKPGSDDHPIPLEGLAEVREILSERNADPLSHAIWLTAKVFPHGGTLVPAYRLLANAQGARLVRSAARAEVIRLAEGGVSNDTR